MAEISDVFETSECHGLRLFPLIIPQKPFGFVIRGRYILIMEEKQTIIACGAGASSKVVFHNEADDNHSVRIERIENVKDVRNYIQRIDEMIDRKKKFFEENNF